MALKDFERFLEGVKTGNHQDVADRLRAAQAARWARLTEAEVKAYPDPGEKCPRCRVRVPMFECQDCAGCDRCCACADTVPVTYKGAGAAS